MWKWFIGLLLEKVFEAVKEAVSDYFKLQEKKKEDKKAVEDAIKLKDPVAKANAIANLLR